MTELHLHLDGSLRPRTVIALAKYQGIKLPAYSEDALISYMRAPEDCKDLNEYLTRFHLPLSVLQKKKAVNRAVFELMEDLAKDGVTYAEIRFAPQLSTKAERSQEDIVLAALDGLAVARQKYPELSGNLILCMMRGDGNEKENMETISLAKKYLHKGVVGLDLAGAEALYKTETFAPLFKRIRALHIPFTIHAGEACGPESVKAALSFGAKRIGHGIRAIEDDALVERLVQEQIPLEVCVLSNLQTKAVKPGEAHPIRALFDRGVHVTINTDNRTVSNTCLQKERAYLKETCGFTEEEFAKMEGYAAAARFL